MKVEQFPYLSPEAVALRRRDGTPPWGVHICEVDDFKDTERHNAGGSPFWDSLVEARALRDEIEGIRKH